MNHKNYILLLILITAFIIRLYRLDTPLADWHSWRQADTASVTREYIKNGIDLLHPQYHDLSSIPNGLDNPQGYRMVEFPFINALIAWLYLSLGFVSDVPIHVFSRLISIIFSIGSTLLIYQIVNYLVSSQIQHHSSKYKQAKHLPILSALVFAFLPFNIFYSRTVLPEVPLVFLSLLTILLSLHYLRTENNYFLYGLICVGAFALLLKPTAFFYFIPIIILYFLRKKVKWLIQAKHLMAAVFMISPFILWRLWISQFPEGIPANLWLLNGNGIRFRPAWFRWLFAERIGKLILGYWGIGLFSMGLVSFITPKFNPLHTLFHRISSWSKDELHTLDVFIITWLISIFSYLAIFATGNVQHDYYQIILVPVISIIVAMGINYLISLNTLPAVMLAIFSVGMMLFMSWYEISGYYNINNPAIVHAGEAVNRLTPSSAMVIAPYQGDTAFLYQTNRRGWPIGGDIEAKIKQGADYYVTTSYDAEAENLARNYQVIDQTSEYLLIHLNK